MALGKYHLIWGIFGYLAFTAVYWFIFGSEMTIDGTQTIEDQLTSISWFFVAFVLAIAGSTFADLDHSIWGLQHRDVLTHSAAIPLVVTIATFLSDWGEVDDVNLLYLILPPFMLAYALHLFADLWPSINLARLKKEGDAVKNAAFLSGWFVTGATSAELTHMLQGTYLIHFWWKSPVAKVKKGKIQKWEIRKTFPKHQTRLWLVGNGLLAVICSFVLAAQFVGLISI
ncbi:MAG: hypothetical protein ACFFCQ_08400 [Promethearchaeota archaeon]